MGHQGSGKEFRFAVSGVQLTTDDAQLTGRQILTAAGFDPASDHVLIARGKRDTRSIGLDEDVDLEQERDARFDAFHGDRSYNFTVDERGYEWGAGTISTAEIRDLAGIADNREIFLDSDDDAVLAPDAVVTLDAGGTERIRSRPANSKTVTIVVNAREKTVPSGAITFEALVTLAFGAVATGPNKSFTVTYRRGLDGKGEGSLIAGQSTKLREGMVFNVTATDKS